MPAGSWAADRDWRSYSELATVGVKRGWLDEKIQGDPNYGVLWIAFHPEQWSAQAVAVVQALTGRMVTWRPGEHLYCWGILGPMWQHDQAMECVQRLGELPDGFR